MIELPLSALTICTLFNFSLFPMHVILFLKRYCDAHIVVDVYKVGPQSWLLAIGSYLVHMWEENKSPFHLQRLCFDPIFGLIIEVVFQIFVKRESSCSHRTYIHTYTTHVLYIPWVQNIVKVTTRGGVSQRNIKYTELEYMKIEGFHISVERYSIIYG